MGAIKTKQVAVRRRDELIAMVKADTAEFIDVKVGILLEVPYQYHCPSPSPALISTGRPWLHGLQGVQDGQLFCSLCSSVLPVLLSSPCLGLWATGFIFLRGEPPYVHCQGRSPRLQKPPPRTDPSGAPYRASRRSLETYSILIMATKATPRQMHRPDQT